MIPTFRFYDWLFPPVDADSNVKPEPADTVNESTEESTDEDGNIIEGSGKKKQKKEKVGFRDRKVMDL